MEFENCCREFEKQVKDTATQLRYEFGIDYTVTKYYSLVTFLLICVLLERISSMLTETKFAA